VIREFVSEPIPDLVDEINAASRDRLLDEAPRGVSVDLDARRNLIERRARALPRRRPLRCERPRFARPVASTAIPNVNPVVEFVDLPPNLAAAVELPARHGRRPRRPPAIGGSFTWRGLERPEYRRGAKRATSENR
jgi:hypothetical protein